MLNYRQFMLIFIAIETIIVSVATSVQLHSWFSQRTFLLGAHWSEKTCKIAHISLHLSWIITSVLTIVSCTVDVMERFPTLSAALEQCACISLVVSEGLHTSLLVPQEMSYGVFSILSCGLASLLLSLVPIAFDFGSRKIFHGKANAPIQAVVFLLAVAICLTKVAFLAIIICISRSVPVINPRMKRKIIYRLIKLAMHAAVAISQCIAFLVLFVETVAKKQVTRDKLLVIFCIISVFNLRFFPYKVLYVLYPGNLKDWQSSHLSIGNTSEQSTNDVIRSGLQTRHSSSSHSLEV